MKRDTQVMVLIKMSYNCAKIFCKKFLGIEVDCIEFKEVFSFENALEGYLEHMKIYEENTKIVFSDPLIELMQSEWVFQKLQFVFCF